MADISPQDAWAKVRDNADPTNFLILGLNDKRAPVVLHIGSGGRNEFVDYLEPGKVMFGAFRVHAIDERGTVTSVRAKFVKVSWVGQSVSPMQRGKVSMVREDFNKILQGCHIDIQTGDVGDVDEKTVESKLQATTGAHKPSRYDFNALPDGDVCPASPISNTKAASSSSFSEKEKEPAAAAPKEEPKKEAPKEEPKEEPKPAGPTNVAAGRTATQSSTADDWKASLASNALSAEGGNSATGNENQPFWEVDLGSVVAISKITVAAGEDTGDATVMVSADPLPPKNNSLEEAKGIAAESWNLAGEIDAAGAKGRFVRVQLNGEGALSLKSVEVMSP